MESATMHELALITVFVAGLFGSTHCLGMCGGIATALGATRAAGARAWQPLLYQFGRISSYGIAGAIVGALGAVAGIGFAISRWSDILRLATAFVVVTIGLDIALGTGRHARWLRAPERLGAILWRRIAPAARAALPASQSARSLALGFLWGWLPCGLVYSALIAAAVAGGGGRGSATMIAFGLGTMPAMLGLSYAGARLPQRDGTCARLLGAIIVACGLWTAVLPIAVLTGAHEHNHQAIALPMPNIGDDGHDTMAMPSPGTAADQHQAIRTP
jgi:sulfite exporter TauE/SafE